MMFLEGDEIELKIAQLNSGSYRLGTITTEATSTEDQALDYPTTAEAPARLAKITDPEILNCLRDLNSGSPRN